MLIEENVGNTIAYYELAQHTHTWNPDIDTGVLSKCTVLNILLFNILKTIISLMLKSSFAGSALLESCASCQKLVSENLNAILSCISEKLTELCAVKTPTVYQQLFAQMLIKVLQLCSNYNKVVIIFCNFGSQ